ncbi:GOLPH3/VPS74 family protein [Polymorphospora rubra]|uniref:GOLPH3/VPS74 family protein n=1 Tax=Polymorphospora rubra TaxID=338584 RepID=UPI0033D1C1FB
MPSTLADGRPDLDRFVRAAERPPAFRPDRRDLFLRDVMASFLPRSPIAPTVRETPGHPRNTPWNAHFVGLPLPPTTGQCGRTVRDRRPGREKMGSSDARTPRAARRAGGPRPDDVRHPLADDLFRLAHHHLIGRPLLHPRATAYGLASALLAELLYTGRITVHHGDVYVLSTEPPADGLTHTVLDQLAAERGAHPVGTWLAYLAGSVVERVAGRLHQAGHVRRETSRLRVPRTVTWVPVEPTTAGWPSARLAMALRGGRRLDPADQGLAALTWATGLDRHVLDGAPARARDNLRALVDHGWPPMAELARLTHAAIGRSVTTYRT